MIRRSIFGLVLLLSAGAYVGAQQDSSPEAMKVRIAQLEVLVKHYQNFYFNCEAAQIARDAAEEQKQK